MVLKISPATFTLQHCKTRRSKGAIVSENSVKICKYNQFINYIIMSALIIMIIAIIVIIVIVVIYIGCKYNQFIILYGD